MMNPQHRTIPSNSPAFPLADIGLFLAIAVIAVLVLARIGAAAPAAGGATTSSITDEQLDASLLKAHGLVETAPAEFVSTLQSVAGRFDALEPATSTEKSAWISVTLNERGKRLDAIRFLVPEGEPRDFVWAFAYPKSLDRWYICPAQGTGGQGFKTFWKSTPQQAFGAADPNLSVRLQSLSSEHLVPGNEYILWFRFTDDKPATLWVNAALLPKTNKAYDARSAAKALALPRALPPSGTGDSTRASKN